jgi:hypothetical protein
MSAVVEMIDAAQPEQEAKILGWQKRLPARASSGRSAMAN